MTESTNDDVRERALAGAEEGLAVLAGRQDRGRGRQGRVWQSPAGAGVYLSVLLRPDLPAYEANWLGVVGALAVAEALETAGMGAVSIKWPNDVLARGRKLAGLLVEPRIDAGRVEWAVLGVGVNVAQSAEELARAGLDQATSCWIEGLRVDTEPLAERVLEHLDGLYRQFRRGARQVLLQEWALKTGRQDLPVMG